MNDNKARGFLEKCVMAYKAMHNKFPNEIVLTPISAAALALKSPYGKFVLGVPVSCREVAEREISPPGTKLVILVESSGNSLRLRASEIT